MIISSHCQHGVNVAETTVVADELIVFRGGLGREQFMFFSLLIVLRQAGEECMRCVMRDRDIPKPQ